MHLAWDLDSSVDKIQQTLNPLTAETKNGEKKGIGENFPLNNRKMNEAMHDFMFFFEGFSFCAREF